MSHESLDPSDWEAMRALGHRMVDDMLQRLESAPEQVAWRPTDPDHEARAFTGEPPAEGEGYEAAYDRFRTDVLAHHPMWNAHPRFWGWMMGTGMPFGMLSDMVIAGLNINAGGGKLVSGKVEEQVLGWFKRLLAFPDDASGLLTTGCSEANLIGIAVARDDHLGREVVQAGLSSTDRRLRLYCSNQTHGSVRKACSLLGLGTEAVVVLGVDERYQLRVDELERALARDRAAGLEPFCVVANAGTINTGAIDDLDQLADLCERHQLWLHVDAAFGAMCALSPELRARVRGLSRASSLATDLHKGFHLPYEAGLSLVAKPEVHAQTFAMSGDYLAHDEPWYCDYGVQLSRRFRAGSAWMCFNAVGFDRYGRLFEQNVRNARRFAALLEAAPQVELLMQPSLNVVCFRAVRPELDPDQHDELNRALMRRIWGSGVALVTTTEIDGRVWLRAGFINHRSRPEDFAKFAKLFDVLNAQLSVPRP